MHSLFEKTKKKLSKPVVSYPLGMTLGAFVMTQWIRSKPFILTITTEDARALLDNPAAQVLFRHRFLGYALLRIVPKP